MSDRLTFGLASIPMFTGVLLVGLLQRPPSVELDDAQSARRGTAAVNSVPTVKPTVGVVTAGQTADLSAGFEGKVTEIFLQTGTRVRAGQPLLEIDPSIAKISVDLAKAELGQRKSEAQRAKARLEEARGKFARYTAGATWLAEQDVASAKSAMHMAQADLNAAYAAVDMVKAKLKQQKIYSERHKLVAPIAGTVIISDVGPGDSVTSGQVLARVVSDDREVRFALPRESLPASSPDKFEVLVQSKADNSQVRAPVSSVKPEIDPAAQLVFATASLPAEQVGSLAFMPGTKVTVEPILPTGPSLESR
ncbi:MAG: efflux RND transporter periplasmic adaptor subunit [Myxococcales bacterium]